MSASGDACRGKATKAGRSGSARRAGGVALAAVAHVARGPDARLADQALRAVSVLDAFRFGRRPAPRGWSRATWGYRRLLHNRTARGHGWLRRNRATWGRCRLLRDGDTWGRLRLRGDRVRPGWGRVNGLLFGRGTGGSEQDDGEEWAERVTMRAAHESENAACPPTLRQASLLWGERAPHASLPRVSARSRAAHRR